MSSSVMGANSPPAEHSAAAEYGVTWSCPELLMITNLIIIFKLQWHHFFFFWQPLYNPPVKVLRRGR